MEKTSNFQVTSEVLLSDNQSSLANDRRAIWYSARESGSLIGIWKCADARNILRPEHSVFIQTIANGGERQPYEKLLNHPGIQALVVLGHFDPEATIPFLDKNGDLVELPGGCGGRKAKKDLIGVSETQNGVLDFVDHFVYHPDPVINTLITAEETARLTDKKVLAVVENHFSGEILPVGMYLGEGRSAIQSVPSVNYLLDRYNPKEIYRVGIPQLWEYEVADIFHPYIRAHERYVQDLHQKYPDLSLTQKVQNPSTVVLSTGIKPLRVRYPNTFDRPNTAFQLTVPRIDLDFETGNLDQLEHAIDQAEYPFAHSVLHFGQKNKDFASTETFFIETGDLGLSEQVASIVMEKPWMQKWLDLGGKQILVGEMQRGISGEIKRVA
jgi:hypothetical protein